MDSARRFFQNYGIPYTERGKHSREGWIQVACPYCTGHVGWHGGFNIADDRFKGRFRCWRCGWHNRTKVIMALTGVSYEHAISIEKEYFHSSKKVCHGLYLPPDRPTVLEFPDGCASMTSRHRKYLVDRNFDDKQIETEWSLMGTSTYGDYAYRIIIPVHYQDKAVSYQGRDITDRSDMKYKACRADEEVIPHQNLLYGFDKVKGDRCVVVEGVTDVWRLGPGAVAVFGIEFSSAQETLLAKRFNEVFIYFDPEEQAQEQANLLGSILIGLGKFAEIITLDNDKDPGELSDQEAKEVMKELLW